MTAEKQRIAIAEFLGWKFGTTPALKDYCQPPPYKFGIIHKDKLPDYIHDLNAIHEAEALLTGKQRGDYMDELETLVENHEWKFIHATASQRAEALLKTIGRWKP